MNKINFLKSIILSFGFTLTLSSLHAMFHVPTGSSEPTISQIQDRSRENNPTTTIVNIDGSTFTRYANGTLIIRSSTTITIIQPDGTQLIKTKEHPNTTTVISPDGGITWETNLG